MTGGLEGGAKAVALMGGVMGGLVLAFGACHDTDRQAPAGRARRGPALRRAAAASPPSARGLRVPHTLGTLRLDGTLDEPDWHRCGRGGPFVAPGTRDQAHPYSEVRFLWDAKTLYLALYAADEDIRGPAGRSLTPPARPDVFTVRFAAPDRPKDVLQLVIGPTGKVTSTRLTRHGARVPWASGVRLGVDRDGTLNTPRDYDEEWVVEAAVPLAALGVRARVGATLRVGIMRCDTPKDGHRHCGTWGLNTGGAIVGALVLAAPVPHPQGRAPATPRRPARRHVEDRDRGAT